MGRGPNSALLALFGAFLWMYSIVLQGSAWSLSMAVFSYDLFDSSNAGNHISAPQSRIGVIMLSIIFNQILMGLMGLMILWIAQNALRALSLSTLKPVVKLPEVLTTSPLYVQLVGTRFGRTDVESIYSVAVPFLLVIATLDHLHTLEMQDFVFHVQLNVPASMLVH